MRKRSKKKRRLPGGVAVNIEDREKIRARLEVLCRERHTCQLELGEEVFTSIFLSAAEDHFLIDILMPSYGNNLLRPEMEVMLSYLQRAVPYRLPCRFLGRSEVEGFDALKFSQPEAIHYTNRRAYFRVAPGESDSVRITIDFGRNKLEAGELKNISGGGVAVRSGLVGSLKPGHKLKAIKIELPKETVIICSGTVRRVSGTIVGIELDDLPQVERQQISRYISDRQKNNRTSGEPEL